MSDKGWVGCDLDGSLAHYVKGDYKKLGAIHIGSPIPKHVERIKAHIARGDRVKILTARVAGPDNFLLLQEIRSAITEWCIEHLGVALEITCVKDGYMTILYDDRAVAIETNTGEIKGFSSHIGDKVL